MPTQAPVLYTTGSSYYSMIARLVLVEKQINFQKKDVDIHVHLEQFSPEYVKLNPNLTIPTLVAGGAVFTSSHDILFFADQYKSAPSLQPIDPSALATMQTLIKMHYDIHIENFTFGKMLAKNPLMYALTSKAFKRELQLCKTNSEQYPLLKDAYHAKATIVEKRMLDFSRENLAATFTQGKKSIVQYLEKLNAQLDNTPWSAGNDYSLADVVSTCLLARIEFCNETGLIEAQPNIKRYYDTVKQRPSFHNADIWNKMHVTKIVSMIVRNLPLLFT